MNSKSNTQAMETEKIPRLLARLAIPAVVAQIINLLYNIVDSTVLSDGIAAGRGSTGFSDDIAAGRSSTGFSDGAATGRDTAAASAIGIRIKRSFPAASGYFFASTFSRNMESGLAKTWNSP